MSHLKSCHCCGLIQLAPGGGGAVCARCETALESWLGRFTGNRLSAALALSALVLYLPAVTLPFLRIEQLGHAHESSLLVGMKTLFTEGQVLVGVIVLTFSIILPVLKLSALLFLSQRRWQLAEKHRALTYRIVEQLGRWGMLDVLLVAVMVAFIKLGGLVEFQAGPGIVAFTLFVLVSLLASATFDPHVLWGDGVMLAEGGERTATAGSSLPQAGAEGGSVPSAIVPERKPRTWQPYLVWLIPVVAALGVGWMVWDSFADRGRLITITFADGHGVETGDEVRYHGIVVGEVESVALAESLLGVVVDIRLTPEADNLAREGTRFWIVRPQADITGIAGLETVVGSKYLTLIPGPHEGPVETAYVGVERPPLPDLEFPGGIEVILQSTEALGLRSGLGVFYRSIRIGGVMNTGLAADGSAVETRIYIRPDYRHLIREQTKFWNAGGIHVVGGLTELSVHVGTVETMIRGGIGVSVPPNAGDEVPAGYRFDLHDHPEQDWLKWKPAVANHRMPPSADRPQLLPAVLKWTHDGVIDRRHSRTGWVLPTPEGLLGPRDLLTVPEETVEGTASLDVDGRAVPLNDDVTSLGSALALLHSKEIPVAALHLRHPSAAENAFLVTGVDTPHFVAATRFTLQEDGSLTVDEGWAVGPSQHGAVVISADDGAVIGIATVNRDRLVVWPIPETH